MVVPCQTMFVADIDEFAIMICYHFIAVMLDSPGSIYAKCIEHSSAGNAFTAAACIYASSDCNPSCRVL